MPLNSYLSDRLHLLEGIEKHDAHRAMEDMEQETLARLQRFADDGDWSQPSSLHVENCHVTNDAHRVPLRIYRPSGPVERVLIWVHGGGFVSGDLDFPEAHVVSAELASRANSMVVSVDYRLAPAVQFPIPVEDVIAVLKYVRTWDFVPRTAPVAVGGASAGAAIALSATLREPSLVDLLLVAYPFVHFPVPYMTGPITAEMERLPPLLRFYPSDIEAMVNAYAGRIHGVPVDALPGTAPVGINQPPTRIIVSEYDDLRPSGELLARQHEQAGVDVALRLERGVPHGHLNRLPNVPGVAESLDWFASHLAGAVRRTP